MVNLHDLAFSGDLWRVSEDIVASSTRQLVIPKSVHAGPNNIGGQPTSNKQNGITILGFVIVFESTGSGTITLESLDRRYPTLGTATANPILKITRSGADTGVVPVAQCAIPLTPGDFQTTPTDGATLQVTATSNISGHIAAWGIHGQLDIGGRNALTGSPPNYNA